MKYIIFAILFFLSTYAVCLSTDTVKTKRIKIGIVVSPDYCYRLLNYELTNKWIEEVRNIKEVPTIGYTIGVGIKMNLTHKLILETGLFNSLKGQQTKTSELVWATSNPDFPVKWKMHYQLIYFDIPLKLNYRFGKRKINYFVSTGASINVFVEQNTKVIMEFNGGGKTTYNSTADLGYLRFNIAAIISFGVNYDLSERMAVSIEPIYRQYLNSIVADSNAKEYPYSFGANIGFYYSWQCTEK